jgi:hypothetical protein
MLFKTRTTAASVHDGCVCRCNVREDCSIRYGPAPPGGCGPSLRPSLLRSGPLPALPKAVLGSLSRRPSESEDGWGWGALQTRLPAPSSSKCPVLRCVHARDIGPIQVSGIIICNSAATADHAANALRKNSRTRFRCSAHAATAARRHSADAPPGRSRTARLQHGALTMHTFHRPRPQQATANANETSNCNSNCNCNCTGTAATAASESRFNRWRTPPAVASG